MYKMKSL